MSNDSSSTILPARPVYPARRTGHRVVAACAALVASGTLLGGMLGLMDAQLAARLQGRPMSEALKAARPGIPQPEQPEVASQHG